MTEQNCEYLEISAPLQNSIEIGETAKGFLYLKSLKLYAPNNLEGLLEKLFDTYDKTKKAIGERNK